MRSNINKIILILTCLFALLFTLKGIEGNPSPEKINNELQSESMPFELSPERGRYALLTSIYDYKSLYFPLEIARYVVPDLGFTNGHYVSLFAPGVSYIALPFYIVGSTVNMGQLFSFSTSAWFAMSCLILIAILVKDLTKNWYAGVASGATFLFATTAWPYSISLYQHLITSSLLLASALLLIKERSFINAFFLGSLIAISVGVDYPNALFIIPFFFGFIAKYVDFEEYSNKFSIKIDLRVIAATLGILIFILLQMYYNLEAYGDPFKLAGTVQSVRTISIEELGTPQEPDVRYKEKSAQGFFKIDNLPRSMSVLLTSKDRGIIWYAPIILLSLFGVLPLYKKNKLIFFTTFASASSILFLYGMWGDPWGGWAFGPRYLIPLFSLSSIYLGIAVNKYAKNINFGIAFILLTLYGLFVNLLGSLTTIQIPPSVEKIEGFPEVSYIHNFQMLYQGKSSSFIFNRFFNGFLELKFYFLILYLMVFAVIFVSYFFATKSEEK